MVGSRRCTHSARSTTTSTCATTPRSTRWSSTAAPPSAASDLRDRAATVKNVFSLGPSSEAEDLIALAQQADATSLKSDAVESDICWLIYTGGTTGRPKGVMDTHRAMTGMALTALAEYEFPREVRYLAASPITHAAGMHVVPTLLRGGTVYLHDKFDPEKYLRTIESERISLCFGVPSMVYALLDHPDLERTDLSSLETFLYAASPMAPARLADGLERIGPVFTQYYAQTECPAATVLAQRHHDPSIPGRLSSCGQPVATMRLALLDEDRNPVATGEHGRDLPPGSVHDGRLLEPTRADRRDDHRRLGPHRRHGDAATTTVS